MDNDGHHTTSGCNHHNGDQPLDPDNLPALLTPSEVADLFRVDPKTVGRWADTGRLRSTKTPGGHRRFRRADVLDAMGRD